MATSKQPHTTANHQQHRQSDRRVRVAYPKLTGRGVPRKWGDGGCEWRRIGIYTQEATKVGQHRRI